MLGGVTAFIRPQKRIKYMNCGPKKREKFTLVRTAVFPIRDGARIRSEFATIRDGTPT